MSWSSPIATWLTRVVSFDAVFTGDAAKDGAANMLAFPAVEAQLASVTPAEMDRFLVEAFRSFSRKLAEQGGKGWFYAWYDEMSGTLRCSAAAVDGPSDLPFSCRLDVLDVPSRVTEAVLTSRYAGGIPEHELTIEDWQDDDDQTEFVLMVFARRLIARV